MSISAFPRLDILPAAQRALVPELGPTAGLGFALYGGTAIALHLGHRRSIDFDFFANAPLDTQHLVDTLSVLRGATVLQSDQNTYTALVPSFDETVKLSFFGGIPFGRVGVPKDIPDLGVWVASLDDLIATKLKALMQRVEPKDYIDIAALVTHGISLDAGLGAAKLFFANTFSPADCLRALEYFEDPQLRSLDNKTKKILHEAVRRVAMNGLISPPELVSSSLIP